MKTRDAFFDMADDKPLYKLILIGDPAVGKTSIRRSFLGNSFELDYLPTIGADISMYESKDSKFAIWDIAGEPNYSVMRSQFYSGAHGIIFVFDISRLNTLKSFGMWAEEISELLAARYPVVFVGNKIDLRDTSEVDNNEGKITEAFVKKSEVEFGVKFPLKYSSAITGFNIEELFEYMFAQITSNKKLYS